jgi:catechol 2,3-dioxygenase-like lactoylglutathione lyase family enzyme
MRVCLNHVALSARDLERSAGFYERLLGCARLAAPDVGFPTVWLSLGERQLHLFERDTPVPPLHHFAVAVDDFAEACRRADALGAFDGAPCGREAYRLPDGTVQLFLRDPDGHLIEIDGTPRGEPPADVVIVPLAELRPQLGEHARATLFQAGSPFGDGSGTA